MSWADLAPLSGRKASVASAVTLVILKDGSRFQPSCRVMLRTECLPGLSFMTPEASVKVQIGTGAEHGRLRIAPNGPYRVSKCGGRTDMVFVRLPLLPGMAEAKQTRFDLDHDYSDHEWLEVTLPGCLIADAPAVSRQPATAPAASAPAKARGSRGFSMENVGDLRSATK